MASIFASFFVHLFRRGRIAAFAPNLNVHLYILLSLFSCSRFKRGNTGRRVFPLFQISLYE